MLVLQILQKRKQDMTEAVILDFLYKLICRIEMPYPKKVLDLVLSLFQGVVNSFKSMLDNQMKGYFFEFLERCLLLKKSGGVDEKLLDAVVASVANVQYICCTVCLRGCQPRRRAFINPLLPLRMETIDCRDPKIRAEECEKTHQLLYELMASYLGDGRWSFAGNHH